MTYETRALAQAKIEVNKKRTQVLGDFLSPTTGWDILLHLYIMQDGAYLDDIANEFGHEKLQVLRRLLAILISEGLAVHVTEGNAGERFQIAQAGTLAIEHILDTELLRLAA